LDCNFRNIVYLENLLNWMFTTKIIQRLTNEQRERNKI
jgi:hypothetical protein